MKKIRVVQQKRKKGLPKSIKNKRRPWWKLFYIIPILIGVLIIGVITVLIYLLK